MDRYKRQIPIIGEEGQEKLKKARVVVVGVGGLGSASAQYLAAAGVGKIGIVDHQRVQESDLNRQLLYTTSDIGKKKTVCAQKRLQNLNPDIEIITIDKKLTPENISLLDEFDIIVDGTDNYETRVLLNGYALKSGKSYVFAAVEGMHGFASVFNSRTPCLRCIMDDIERREDIPVIGTTPAALGVIQALEAIKLIVNGRSSLEGNLLIFNGESLTFDKVEVKRNEGCAACKDINKSGRKS